MVTAMVKAQKFAEKVGQEYVVFTADQQNYRVAPHVQWENQTQLSNIHLRLGGIHILMSYCSNMITLIAGTGIQEILSTAFGGVLKMLTGIKYPQNVRAFRTLFEELPRPIFPKTIQNACKIFKNDMVNVMLSLMSVMSPPPALCNISVRTVVKLCTLGGFALGVRLVS